MQSVGTKNIEMLERRWSENRYRVLMQVL